MNQETTDLPTLDIVPAEYHKASILSRYRRAITDERLDQMHDRVKRDLKAMNDNNLLCMNAYRLALIEAWRAYGARQEEFDNPSASLLEKRAKGYTVASTPSVKNSTTTLSTAVKAEPLVGATTPRQVFGSLPARGYRAMRIPSPVASVVSSNAAKQPTQAPSASSSWSAAEAEMKRLLNQMSDA